MGFLDYLHHPFHYYNIPLDQWVATFIKWLSANYRFVFQAIGWPVDHLLTYLEWFFHTVPPLGIVALVAVLAVLMANWRVALFSVVALIFVGFLGLWDATMTTFSMIISALVFSVIIGIPLGILSAQNEYVAQGIRPILDIMQTTPAFVYLVPVVMLFGIGTVPGIIATVIFSMPPIIRLTNLGIRQVQEDAVEAATAFGSNRWEILKKVQFPLALPTIMAGLNQTLLLSLAMVVIAALIGAGGLGRPVLLGLNSLQVGLAAIAGLSIVLLAMVVDRITQGLYKG